MAVLSAAAGCRGRFWVGWVVWVTAVAAGLEPVSTGSRAGCSTAELHHGRDVRGVRAGTGLEPACARIGGAGCFTAGLLPQAS